ncbi:hypothetical protein KAT72_21520 [Aeromonas popoffii]|uniref:EfeO-type cupredoxin-like domain-containing protein n=1 Tax=Aeromonas popoffii TaxID=70856 RepID=A0ABS5GWS7_9GAMM|nr:hypothetical protein [Aeromonas popoffii]MBR7631498.1 hypothetical protein [Aeromonas popoffii]
MKRYLIAAAVLAASAVIYTSASDGTKASPPEFKLDVQFTALNRPLLHVTSLNDAVTIEKVIVNRGQCRVAERKIDRGLGSTFPVVLKFGQLVEFAMIPASCDLLEATLFTVQGEVAYTFQ